MSGTRYGPELWCFRILTHEPSGAPKNNLLKCCSRGRNLPIPNQLKRVSNGLLLVEGRINYVGVHLHSTNSKSKILYTKLACLAASWIFKDQSLRYDVAIQCFKFTLNR